MGMLKWTILVSTVLATALPVMAQDNDATLPDGPGKPIVQRMCTGCHKLKVVTSKHATKEQWATIVQQMVSRGAEGTDEEIDTVIDYLAKNFPPQKDEKAPPPASQSSIEHVGPNQLPNASLLTMSQSDVDSMLRYWRQSSEESRTIHTLALVR